MYAINGVPLQEAGLDGWRILRNNTNFHGGITNSLIKVSNPNRPGYFPAPSTYAEQVIVIVVRTPLARLDELLALCAAARVLSRVDDASKELYVELASAIPSSNRPFDLVQDVAITLSAYQGVWRDVSAVAAGPIDITTPTQTETLLPGISAPVFDADVFLRGVFGEFVLTDSGGSWLRTTGAWAGSSSTGLLYVGATQQAFLANESDPWVPISDMSAAVDVSGSGGFRLTPKLAAGDPSDRNVSLTLTTLSQTSTTLRVRAKRAYRMN